MIKVISIIIAVLIILVGGFYYLNNYIYQEKQADESFFNLGVYGYRCGDGTEFTMSPASDMGQILLTPATSVERIPKVILTKAASATGARYEGDGLVFYAHGERVELSSSEFTTTCIPMQVPAEAPFNFGD
ncbi:MliC family protein [Candidatus Parcubacteria bacterium]|nr:MliC family protein [Candidatus Parcubacteria bacterium]